MTWSITIDAKFEAVVRETSKSAIKWSTSTSWYVSIDNSSVFHAFFLSAALSTTFTNARSSMSVRHELLLRLVVRDYITIATNM